MSNFELTNKYSNLYIHRKNRNLIEAETKFDKDLGSIVHTIFKSNNGIREEILTENPFSSALLPLTCGDI